MTVEYCVGVPRAPLGSAVNWEPSRDSVEVSERTAPSAEGRGSWGGFQGSQEQLPKSRLSVESHRTCLISPLGVVTACDMVPIEEAHWRLCPRTFLGDWPCQHPSA